MQQIIDMLIIKSKPKLFRGKPTNRKMFNFGTKYYDDSIPYYDVVPMALKDYFDIDNKYNNCFVNVYKNNDLIGIHKDKIENMDTTQNIISVSIGVDKNGIIQDIKDLKLGWMEINNKKVNIYNKTKIYLDYDSPHRAKTKISDDILYRINFTFRVSKTLLKFRFQTRYDACEGCNMLCEDCESLLR